METHVYLSRSPVKLLEDDIFSRGCLFGGRGHVIITHYVLNLTVEELSPLPRDMLKLVQLGPHCTPPPVLIGGYWST